MKFSLKSAAMHYSKKESDKLKKVGFTFKKDTYGIYTTLDNKEEGERYEKINKRDEYIEIEFTRLSQLLDFIKEYGTVIVSDKGETDFEIKLYDDYIE